MKVAFTHNLRLTDRLADKERDRYDGAKYADRDAEFDSVETINAIVSAIEAAGHEVEKVEVSGPASALLERLESIDPDIVFNIAAGQGGRLREALYPALFDELSLPYTGSDAHTSALAVDKWVTKLLVGRAGIDTPRATLVTPRSYDQVVERGPGLAFPVIIKPNTESGSHAARGGARAARPAVGAAIGGPGVPGRCADRGVHRGHRRRRRLHRRHRPRQRPAHAGRAAGRGARRGRPARPVRRQAEGRRAGQGPVPLPGQHSP
jgi:hypothetical protein